MRDPKYFLALINVYYTLSIFHVFNLTYVFVVSQHHDESETGLIDMQYLILTTVSRDVCLLLVCF